MKNIALTGGGTAGHITPNIALLPELKKRNFNIVYIGMKNGMEKDICDKHNIPFFGVTCDKLRRYHDVKNFKMPINVIKGIIEAKNILRKQNINIVFSKGGFVALPVVIAAHRLRIPVISHESDITLGLANKLALPFSKIICTNFKETAEKLPHNKGIYTGSPVRNVLFDGDPKKGKNILNFKNDKPILLIIGGSLGSVTVNNIIRKNIDRLLIDFNIVHSCGVGKVDKNINKEGYIQYELIKEELPDIYAVSDIVISRAGANVIFEFLALNKVNMLIPLGRNASRGDQILNANYFKNKGWSEVILEEELYKNENLFIDKLNNLYKNRDQYKKRLEDANLGNVCVDIVDIIESNI